MDIRGLTLEALSLCAAYTPRVIADVFKLITAILNAEPEERLRNLALTTLSAYARTSHKAAERVFPLAAKALDAWKNSNSLAALAALANVAKSAPELMPKVRALATPLAKDDRELVRKAARGLLKAIDTHHPIE